MDAQRFQRVSQLFEEARQRPAEQRDPFLAQQCAGDDSLLAQVRALLEFHERPEGPLDAPALQAALDLERIEAQDLASSATQDVPFHTIGRYRIIRLIGEGGMGSVFEAQQDNPRRVVALKIIRSGMALASPGLLRRFEAESQMLGRLQHPGIAQIFEAGVADTGHGPQPFFAMEYVNGLPLTEFTALHELGTRDRLKLFVKICHAVEHAHQKGVIHRDLKPANILVMTEGTPARRPGGTAGSQGAPGTDSTSSASSTRASPSYLPKILDFGVARATDSDIQVTTLQTDVGQLVGTLAYMSPEQVAGDPTQLDTRSDVYALGTLLYELLAGRLPHDLRRKSIPDAARIIRDEDPTPLSSIDRVFRGDLETIVAKALEKDKTRRYQSAGELAADIERYLGDEPIIARPSSAMYQLSKFARRNKALVGGVAATLVVLFLGVIATTIMAVQAIRAGHEAEAQKKVAQVQQARAESKAAIATAVNEFVNNMLGSADPEKQGRDITVREVLERAAKTVDESFKNQPEVEANVRQTLGMTYFGLGLYDLAEPHLRKAQSLFEKSLGKDSKDNISAMSWLSYLLQNQGKLDESEVMLREVITLQQRVFGKTHSETLGSFNNLGLLLKAQGKMPEAEALLRQVLDMQRHEPSTEPVDLVSSMCNLADIIQELGKLDEAEALLREGLDLGERKLGPDHPRTNITRGALGTVLQSQGKFADAEPLMRQGWEGDRKALGPEHPNTLTSLHNLASIQINLNHLDEAETLFRQTLEARRRVLGSDHLDTLITLSSLGSVLMRRGELTSAEPLLEEAFNRAKQSLPQGHWVIWTFERTYGINLSKQGRFADAEPLLLDAYQGLQSFFGPGHVRTNGAVQSLIDLYEAQGQSEKAATYRALMPATTKPKS